MFTRHNEALRSILNISRGFAFRSHQVVCFFSVPTKKLKKRKGDSVSNCGLSINGCLAGALSEESRVLGYLPTTSLCLSLFVSLSLSGSLIPSLSVCLSACLSVCLSVCLPPRLCLCPLSLSPNNMCVWYSKDCLSVCFPPPSPRLSLCPPSLSPNNMCVWYSKDWLLDWSKLT